MKATRTPAADIIDFYAQHRKPDCALRLNDGVVDYLYAHGLAPMAFSIVEPRACNLSGPSRELLHSADITARIIFSELRETTVDLLNIANRHGIPVALLKGITIAETLYREAHHRTMGDIDVLVPASDAPKLQTLLCEAGFTSETHNAGSRLTDRHHHLPTIYHPRTGRAIEIHTALFSKEPLCSETLFSSVSAWNNVAPAEFHGESCLRPSSEYLFCYTLAHWARDPKWAVNLLSLSDLILFLRRSEPAIDWSVVQSWMSTSSTLADYIANFFLIARQTFGIQIPQELVRTAYLVAKRTGALNLSILGWLMHAFPLSGRPRAAWVVTRPNALILWRTLLEPRHKSLRILTAAGRVLSRRNPDRSYFSSYARRLRTLIKWN